MQHPVIVREGDRRQHLLGIVNCLLRGQTAAQPILQRPLSQGRYDRELPIDEIGILQRQNIGMLQSRRRAGFAIKERNRLVVYKILKRDFERYANALDRVTRLIDDRKTALTDATLDQAEVIQRMTDYITANRDKISAMIGLGDMVTGSVVRVWNQAGLSAGDIPVVGWGNSLDTTQGVMDGFVSAAMWQDPQATSYMCLSSLLMETSGIPVGFNIITGALYEADHAPLYHGIMGGN